MNYGWMCRVKCCVCGAEFEVHPESNSRAPYARFCDVCRVAHQLVESCKPPQPIRYHTFSRFNWRAGLRSPLNVPRAYYIWLKWMKDNYGVEVAERRIKLYPLAHIVLSDEEVLP